MITFSQKPTGSTAQLPNAIGSNVKPKINKTYIFSNFIAF